MISTEPARRGTGTFVLGTLLLLLAIGSTANGQSCGFTTYVDMSRESYRTRLTDLGSQGWRPTKVDVVVNAAGDARYSAIWVPWDFGNEAETWAERNTRPLETFLSDLASFKRVGYKPVSITAYTPDGHDGPLFSAIWYYDPGTEYRYEVGMSASEFRARNCPLSMRASAGEVPILGQPAPPPVTDPGCAGLRLVDVDGYQQDGELRFAAVWYIDDQPRHDGRIEMSKHDFDWEIDPEGFQPVGITAYPDGRASSGVGFAKIWGAEEDAIHFSWGHLDIAEFGALFNRQAGRGYCMLDIGVYLDEDGIVRYLSLWRAPDPEMLKLSMPMGGVPNRDWVIVNYQDHDPSSGMEDYKGNQWLYNQHNGTDFTLRNFQQMDDGVDVLAAAPGTVVSVVDGNFDRNTCGIPGGTCSGSGNEVVIEHANGQRTWYTHLRKNSVAVSVNDEVKRGQKIGEVGSSGSSSDAHLHFAVLNPPYDRQVPAGDLVDPYDLENGDYLWAAMWPYQADTLNVLDADTRDRASTRLEFTERPPGVREFHGPFGPSDRVHFWVQWSGTSPAPDSLVVRLLRPDGSEFASAPMQDSVRYNWAPFDYRLQSLVDGDWAWVVEKDGEVVVYREFSVTR